jgi:hypothetical protein
MSIKRLGRQKGNDYPAGLNLSNYGSYQVTKSLRFRDSATAYLNRTFSTPTNNKIWTYSCWFKRSKGIQDYNVLFGAGNPGSGTQSTILRQNAGVIEFVDAVGGGATYTSLATSGVLRDYSAWYHIVVVFDSYFSLHYMLITNIVIMIISIIYGNS